MVAVMFVCLGNICRSPAGEAILKGMLAKEHISDEQVHVESCGMGDWHIGRLADPRMRKAALDRGISIVTKAQQFEPFFLDVYDYVLAADHAVLHDLHSYAKTPVQKAKIHMITGFSLKYTNQEVPDPYYQGLGSFDLVLDILEDSCHGLMEELRSKLGNDSDEG